jgi:hypothetical protein
MDRQGNNIANKPAGEDDWLHIPVCQRKAQTVAKSTGLRRHIRGLTKSIETLAKACFKIKTESY